MDKMKKTAENSRKLIKGMPSAVVLSILFHAGLFVLAGVLVIFTILPSPPVEFEPPPKVKVPKMPLKKLQIKMKKPSKPKSTAKITAMVPKLDLHEIQFPDLASSGIGAGLGGGSDVVGFADFPDIEETSVFGADRSIGNDFEGTFFNLNHRRDGGFLSMNGEELRAVLRKFVLSGWNSQKLFRYYRSEKKLYATHFMIPPIPSVLAPDVFGEPEMESYYFFVKYKGKLVYPEDIKFRFWGVGDAFLFVRVDGKEVLLNGWNTHLVDFNWWHGNDPERDQYYLGNRRMEVGDWITLKAGEPVDMEVLFGEWKGDFMSAMLLVEVDGVDYPVSRQGGPFLPAFRTSAFSQDTLEEIQRYLSEGEACLTNGPVFSDY